jgi:hypothetical protein
VLPPPLAWIQRNLIQVIDGIKSQIADHKLKNALDTFIFGVIQTRGLTPIDQPITTLKKELITIANLFPGDTLPLENIASIFLAQMDAQDQELLVTKLCNPELNIDPVKDEFLSRIATILQTKFADKMDQYALRTLDGLAEALRTHDRNEVFGEKRLPALKMAAHEPKVYSPLMLRSLILKRHPNIAARFEQVTFSRINSWFGGQSPKMRKKIDSLVETVTTPGLKGSQTEEIQLQTFAQLVKKARNSSDE